MKTITVPSNISTTNIDVTINDKTYVLIPGTTISVEDAVADQIAEMLLAYTHGEREPLVPAPTAEAIAKGDADTLASAQYYARTRANMALTEAKAYADDIAKVVEINYATKAYLLKNGIGIWHTSLEFTGAVGEAVTAEGNLYATADKQISIGMHHPVASLLPENYLKTVMSIHGWVEPPSAIADYVRLYEVTSTLVRGSAAGDTLHNKAYTTTNMGISGTLHIVIIGEWEA